MPHILIGPICLVIVLFQYLLAIKLVKTIASRFIQKNILLSLICLNSPFFLFKKTEEERKNNTLNIYTNLKPEFFFKWSQAKYIYKSYEKHVHMAKLTS